MKKTTLVPTDFSPNAAAAAYYAAEAARTRAWKLHLVHTYLAYSSKFAEEDFNKEVAIHEENKSMQEMTALVQQLAQDFPDLEVTFDCIEGDFSKELIAIAGKAGNELIIMGCQGATAAKYVLLGSNTLAIVRQSPIPVLAVPGSTRSAAWQRVGMLSNYQASEAAILQQFQTLAADQPFQLTLLHVQEEQQDTTAALQAWAQHLQEQTGITLLHRTGCISRRLDDSESLPECIIHMAETEDLDVLLVTYNEKSFFRNLFGKSLVKALIRQFPLPLLFIGSR